MSDRQTDRHSRFYSHFRDWFPLNTYKIPVCVGAAHHLVVELGFNITDQLLHHQNTKSRVFSSKQTNQH